jgi:hypothetical protein
METASGRFESVTGQKHREVAVVDDAGRNPKRIQSGVYRHDRNQTRKQDSAEPPDTWTVCPVVWEDGGGQPPPPTRLRCMIGRENCLRWVESYPFFGLRIILRRLSHEGTEGHIEMAQTVEANGHRSFSDVVAAIVHQGSGAVNAVALEKF